MKAVVYEAFSAPPQIQHVPDPTPEAHGVVVKVMATGVCCASSRIWLWDWRNWLDATDIVFIQRMYILYILVGKGRGISGCYSSLPSIRPAKMRGSASAAVAVTTTLASGERSVGCGVTSTMGMPRAWAICGRPAAG